MNESVNNGINERERNPLHEKLCAYLLDEASEAERAEVEAALAVSPELRAERARLMATIGLVGTTLAAGAPGSIGDELSPTASAALQAAAEARRGRAKPRWYQRPSLQLAAGLAAVGLLWVTWGRSREEPDSSPFIYNMFGGDTTVAQRDQRSNALGDQVAPAASLAKKDGAGAKNQPEAALESLRGLGYVGTGGSSASGSAFTAADSKAVAKREGELTGQMIEELDALGYADETEDLAAERMVLTRPASPAPGSAGPRAASGAAGLPGAELSKEQPSEGKPSVFYSRRAGTAVKARQSEAGDRAALSSGAVPTGTDDFFLGAAVQQNAVPQDEQGASPFIYNVFGDEDEAASEDSELVRELQELGYLGESEDRLHALGYTSDDDEETSRFREPANERSLLQGRLMQVLDTCQRYPDERPRDMFFRFFGDNPFQATVVDPLSTFAADVDTASYALARRYLVDGVLPEKAQIRTEEFVNYFDPDVPAPLEETFAIHTELAPSRFGEPSADSWMLRVAVRGKDVSREERQPLALTFVIDVSGSMKEDGRLELVKHSLRLLLGELDARDSIAIVAFSNEARVVLPMTSARNRSLAETAIYQLQPDGSTNAEAGLRLGYELARSELAPGSHHRVVLLSDGVANVGQTSQRALSDAVEEHRRAGIYLNTVGVGMGNHNDALLEQLADKGDGVCNYVDDAAEARRALVERFTGAFEPIARDVKIQVEFDPAQVQRYRLLGYENRAVADRDFRNDAVDAGEINAGHQVVALYELSARPSEGSERPLATVRLRYKPPHAVEGQIAERLEELGYAGDGATEIEHAVAWKDAAPGFPAASPGYRRSVLVAQFAEFLRRSVHARSDSLDELLAETRVLAREENDPDVGELADMVARSRELILTERSRHGDFVSALESVREACYLQAQLEELNLLLGRDRLHDLEDTLRELAERIRLLRERVQAEEFFLHQGELEAFQAENDRLAALVSELLRELSTASRR